MFDEICRYGRTCILYYLRAGFYYSIKVSFARHRNNVEHKLVLHKLELELGAYASELELNLELELELRAYKKHV